MQTTVEAIFAGLNLKYIADFHIKRPIVNLSKTSRS